MKFLKSLSDNVIPQTWSKPVTEFFKMLWNVQQSGMDILTSDLFHGTLYNPTTFQVHTEILKELEQ